MDIQPKEQDQPANKFGGYIVGLLVLGLIAALVFNDSKKPDAVSDSGWVALNDGTGVEYKEASSFILYLKEYSEEHVVYAYVTDEGFHAAARWKVGCEEGTEIETSKTYSTGEPMMLRCQADGWLSMSTLWRDGDPVFWRNDFDGFEVHTDFTKWNFSKGRQFATLQKAKKVSED